MVIDKILDSVVAGDGGCWIYTGFRDGDGYDKLKRPGRRSPEAAHRISYRELVGQIPDGQIVCHRCDNPPCVRPDHLFLGSTADNHADRNAKGRQARGDRVNTAKLTEADVIEIRRRADDGERDAELAAVYGVSRPNIGMIRRRRTWRHV